MTNQELYDLMDRFERGGIHTLKLSTQDFTIELSKAPAAGSVPAAGSAPGPAVAAMAPAPEAAPAPAAAAITAPMVGTFYAAPAPDQAPFVAVGDRVKAGQTVCLIEAMKMMSEVTAPCDCVIEAAEKESGALVSFGEALFRYRAV